MVEGDFSRIAVFSFGPAAFGLAYFYYGAKYGAEKSKPLVIAFLAGMVAGPLALGAFTAIEWIPVYNRLMGNMADQPDGLLLAFSLFVIGPVEEVAKLFVLWLFMYNRAEFDRPVDGLTFACAVGLGFASVENWYAMSESGEDWARAILLPFLHPLFSSLWGVGLAYAKFGKSLRYRNFVFVCLPLSLFTTASSITWFSRKKSLPLFVMPLVVFLWFFVASSLRFLNRSHPG